MALTIEDLQAAKRGASQKLSSAKDSMKDVVSGLKSGDIDQATIDSFLGKTSSGSGTSASGKPATTTTSDLALELQPVKPYEPAVPYAPVDTSGAMASSDAALESLSEMMTEMKAVNADRLAGKISGDVADQIRVNSAETALATGINPQSPAARSLQARDFGLTSMDIQERGLATAKDIAVLQSEIVKLSENRFQFMTNLGEQRKAAAEQSKQFGASLEQDALRTQLAYQEMLLKQDMFNAEQNYRMLALLSEVTTAQASLQVSAAQDNIDDSAITSSFNSLITNLSNILSRSNPQA